MSPTRFADLAKNFAMAKRTAGFGTGKTIGGKTRCQGNNFGNDCFVALIRHSLN